MTRRGLILALAIPLSTVTGAGVAHADVCTTMTSGTYRIDGVYGAVPKVRTGGSRQTDNTLHLDAPDQSATAFEVMVIPTRQQGGYTPGPAPSVQLSVDGGPAHRFSFTWKPALQSGNLGTWNSNRVEFGGLTRGDHVLHETLSMPVGSPDGVYELGAYLYPEGPCSMVTGTKMGGVSFEFTGGGPAQAPTPAPGGATTRKPDPRPTATRTSAPRTTPTGTPVPQPAADPASPVPSEAPPSPTPEAPSPSASAVPSATPSPAPTPTDRPAAVPLAATPAAHGSPVLPWALGTSAVLAAATAGGVLAVRRRRATPGAAAAPTTADVG
ncbi:hypothetical protein [Kitasatospora sp. MBT63]|uniref:hypothetical protein n=1 Tax=Kitasatospora sp. MBT63 TaxID=1444768 RepID=UPI000539BEA3|nr:hypothetical protein [Kitasatospora sp. MBT63]